MVINTIYWWHLWCYVSHSSPQEWKYSFLRHAWLHERQNSPRSSALTLGRVGWEQLWGEKGRQSFGGFPTARHFWDPVERKLCTQWRNSHGPGQEHGNLRISHGFHYQGGGILKKAGRGWPTETPSLWQSCLTSQSLLLNVLEFLKITFRALRNQGERRNKKGNVLTGYLVSIKLTSTSFTCIPHLVLLTPLWVRKRAIHILFGTHEV